MVFLGLNFFFTRGFRVLSHRRSRSNIDLLPQWLNVKLFLVGFPTKNDETKKFNFFFFLN